MTKVVPNAITVPNIIELLMQAEFASSISSAVPYYHWTKNRDFLHVLLPTHGINYTHIWQRIGQNFMQTNEDLALSYKFPTCIKSKFSHSAW